MRTDNKPLRPEVLLALANLPGVQGEVRAAAKGIRRRAAALAPKATGRLRRGIAFERAVDEQGPHYVVGWNESAFYGVIVEFGHEYEPPRPHLVPATIAPEGEG